MRRTLVMKLASYLESEKSRALAQHLVKNGRRFGLVLYVVGVLGFALLVKDLGYKRFVDENALMPGLVKREFSNDGLALKLAEDFSSQKGDDTGWVLNQFASLRLEVYEQNFTVLEPVRHLSKDGAVVSGTNVYAILRSGRASSTESIVFSAPFSVDGVKNTYGLSLMLSLADYFKTKNYWAKDIVFLVVSHGVLGMQAWADAYLGVETKGLHATALAGRPGAIQAVVNVELLSPSFEYIDIIGDGVNGLLANLDLVTVVGVLCSNEGIPTAYYVPYEFYHLTPGTRYYYSLKSVVASAFHRAPGLPSRAHSVFSRHRIDSVTVQGAGQSGVSMGLKRLGRALEGVFRSLNNLMETLHHSEFFYFTPSLSRFISIGLYSPPFGLLLMPIVIEALIHWLLSRIPDLLNSTASGNSMGIPQAPPFPFRVVVRLLLCCYASGVLLYGSPALVQSVVALLFSPDRPLGGGSPASLLLASLALISSASFVLVPLALRAQVTPGEWRMEKAIYLLVLLVVLVGTAMVNFSLSLFLTPLLSLPSILAQPVGASSNKLTQVARMVAMVMLTPPLCVFYLCCAYSYFNSSHTTLSPYDVVSAGFSMATSGAVVAYNSWWLYGSWLHVVCCLVLWPQWLMAWSLCWHKTTPPSSSSPSPRLHPHSD